MDTLELDKWSVMMISRTTQEFQLKKKVKNSSASDRWGKDNIWQAQQYDKIPEEISKDLALTISQLLTKDTQSPVGISDCPGDWLRETEQCRD